MCSRIFRTLSLIAVLLAATVTRIFAAPAACDFSSATAEAQTELFKKQFGRASTLLDRLSTCDSLNNSQKFEIGWLYGRTRNFTKALALFQSVPLNTPDASMHRYAVALSLFELHRYRAVISTLLPTQTYTASDEDASNLLAVSYSKLGEYRQAHDVLQEQVSGKHAGLKTYLNLITVCAEGGDTAQALTIAERATTLFPQSPDLLIADGAANALNGRMPEASHNFNQAIALAPERADAVFFAALVDYNASQFGQALSTLDRGFSRGIQDSDLHYLKAECLLKLSDKEPDVALKESERAVELNPQSAAALTLSGRLLLERGDAHHAIANLESAHNLDPALRSATYALARAYRMNGNEHEAKALFNQIHSTASDTIQELGSRRLNQALTGDQPQP